MLKRLMLWGILSALLFAPVAARAADDKDGPMFMLRLQSIDKILENAEYVTGLAGDNEQAAQIKAGLAFVKLLIGDKGIEGVDTKRPFAIYATLAEALPDSQVVLMLPITDQKELLEKIFKGRLMVEPEEKDGLYTLKLEQFPEPIYFRFANKYMYATARNKENVDVKKLGKPEDVIGKDVGLLSLAVRLDRLSEEMKKFAFAQIEQQLATAKQQPIPNETKAIKELKEKGIDSFAAGLKAVMFESKTVTVKIDIDAKKDELALEFDLSGISGSSLAKDFANWKANKSVVLGSLFGKNTAMAAGISVALPASVRKALDPVVDEFAKMGQNMVPGEAAEVLIKAIIPTLKAGELDGGFAVFGPDKKGQYTSVFAGKIVGGKKLEAAIKGGLKENPLPGDIFKLDADSIGEHKLHELKVNGLLDDNARKMFGESSAWLAFRDDMLLMAFGPDSKEALKTVLTSKPAEAPIAKFEMAFGKVVPLLEAQTPGASKIAKEVFGEKGGDDTITLTVDPGESLKVRLAMRGKTLQFGAKMSELEKKQKKEN